MMGKMCIDVIISSTPNNYNLFGTIEKMRFPFSEISCTGASISKLRNRNIKIELNPDFCPKI